MSKSTLLSPVSGCVNETRPASEHTDNDLINGASTSIKSRTARIVPGAKKATGRRASTPPSAQGLAPLISAVTNPALGKEVRRLSVSGSSTRRLGKARWIVATAELSKLITKVSPQRGKSIVSLVVEARLTILAVTITQPEHSCRLSSISTRSSLPNSTGPQQVTSTMAAAPLTTLSRTITTALPVTTTPASRTWFRSRLPATTTVKANSRHQATGLHTPRRTSTRGSTVLIWTTSLSSLPTPGAEGDAVQIRIYDRSAPGT